MGAGTRWTSEAATLLGATPITLTSVEMYSAAQRGMVSSLITSALAVVTFKFYEITKYHVDVPFGLTPVGFFMNKEAYARLPEKGRKAIDETSGLKLSKLMATAAENQLKLALVKLATPPLATTSLDAAELKRWKAKLAPITAEWEKRTPNGPAVLAAYHAELAKLGVAN